VAKYQFAERATSPARGLRDILRWKVLDPLRGRNKKAANFAELDAVRPNIVDGGEVALLGASPAACWIGHASWCLRFGGQLIAIDPIWSTAIGGVARRLVAPGVRFDLVPPINIVCVTHNHMDHMDVPTLRRIAKRDQSIAIVPLGLADRMRSIGFATAIELDWWQTHTVDELQITLVPARHWSMRAPWTKNKTLWGGFVIRHAKDGVAYHSGDTAGGDHFADIAQRIGPIDWAMLPIGAYEPRWFMEPQHANPQDAGAGFLALGAGNLLAMHWGTFRLTDEPIGEPPMRMRAWWHEQGLPSERLWIMGVGEARQLLR
jgi:N-acyl-phosphatidylethanolamine-hydrolysing phospholipase D